MSNLRLAYTNQLEQVNGFIPGLLPLLNQNSISYGSVLGTTNGSKVITRSDGGNFFNDGVKPFMGLGGTLATKFPGGTRVASNGVSSSTVTTDTNSNQANASNISGSFNATQGLIQDANFPMANVLNANRYSVWDPGATAGGFGYPITILLEFWLGSSKPNAFFACLAPRTYDLTIGGLDHVDIDSGTAYGTWTNRASVDRPDSTRDLDYGVLFTQVSAAFWRLSLLFNGRSDVGGLWLGTVDQDLGPTLIGASVERMVPSSTLSNPATGRPFYSRVGPERKVLRYPWSSMQTATHDKVKAAFQNIGLSTQTGFKYRTPLLIDENDQFQEVEWSGQRLGPTTHVVSGVESLELVLEQLP